MLNKIFQKILLQNKDKHFSEILRGSVWSFGAKIFAVLLGLVLNLMIARLYGAESMGIYTLISSFFSFALILSLMGTKTSILRLVPEYISKYSFSSGINIYKKLILTVTFLSIALTAIAYFNIEFVSTSIFKNISYTSLFILATFFIIPQALGTLNINALRAFKSIKLFAAFQVINPAVKLMALIILTFISTDMYNPIYAMLYTYVIVALISFTTLYYTFKKHSDITKTTEDTMGYVSILTLSFPMFLTAAMHTVMSETDVVMLGIMTTTETVGIYAVAMKLSVLTSFILGTINTMAAPKFSELYHSGNLKSLKSVAQKSSKLMFWSTLPIVLTFVLFGKFFLGLFGPEFIIAYVTLLLLIVGQFINAIVGSVGFFLNMTGHQKELNIIVIFAGIMNIFLNYFFIPLYGIEGAAIASAISLILWNVLAALYIKQKFGFFIGYLPEITIKQKG